MASVFESWLQAIQGRTYASAARATQDITANYLEYLTFSHTILEALAVDKVSIYCLSQLSCLQDGAKYLLF